MGKRVSVAPTEPSSHITPESRNIRKRKRASNVLNTSKSLRLNANTTTTHWQEHENDDEDSSSNDETSAIESNRYANNSSTILLNTSSLNTTNESPRPTYTLRPSVVNGTILYDLMQKPWRLGNPIGKGNFGEIFLASDNISSPVTNGNAKFVVKIEPHSNGPLFVEIHCLMNTAERTTTNGKEHRTNVIEQKSKLEPSGIPTYIASGSHYFGDARYRFLVLPRFDRDLYSLIKNSRVHQKCILILATQIVNVLEKLHNKGYCHNDVKAQNLMISKCKYYRKAKPAENGVDTKKLKIERNCVKSLKNKFEEHYDERQQTTDSGNSSEQETNDDEDFIVKRNVQKNDTDEDDEDFDDGATSNSNNSNSNANSISIYETPVNRNRKTRGRNGEVEFSGSNPVRACRRAKRNTFYDEMVTSHYLRPHKRVSYSEFFNEDGNSNQSNESSSNNTNSSDEDFEQFVPRWVRQSAAAKSSEGVNGKRSTRYQQKSSQLPANNNNTMRMQHQRFNSNNGHCVNEESTLVGVEEERIFLIDFGLASKFIDNGIHRPFVMDQRRAHDGTLEFTSRDAHMGAHSRRSDLECLGFNLIYWSQGYLPWKEAALQHQKEKVHRAKEIMMTDVREMLKLIYGKQVPKYLGEFLYHVSKLSYHERPDYALYRRIFQREFQQLGYTLAELRLDSNEVVQTCVRVKEEIENKYDIFEMSKHNVSGNLTGCTPFHERTQSNRVSPKNLRSKSDKKSMKKKKFSWAEILSQDPDQIARERAEKEFDREEKLSEVQQPAVRRYEGNPTYAILEIQQRLKLCGRLVEQNGTQENMRNEESDQEINNYNDNDSDNSDDDDEESDSDINDSDTSGDKLRGHGRNRTNKISRNQKQTKMNVSSIKMTKNNNNNTSIKRASTTKTKKSLSAISEPSRKRNMTSRLSRKGMKSDLEIESAQYLSSDNGRASMGGVVGNGRSSKRRTRRCLNKTEMEGYKPNAHYGSDMIEFFNNWKRDAMFIKESGAAKHHHKK